MFKQIFFFLISLHLSLALSMTPIQTKCTAKAPKDPPVQPASCINALSAFLRRYPDSVYSFSTPFHHLPGTVTLPLCSTYRDCTIKVSLFYVFHVRESMSKVTAAVDEVIEDCVGTRRFNGGSKAVGNKGLWVNVLPTEDVGKGSLSRDNASDTGVS